MRVLYSSRKVALTSVVTIVQFAVNACAPIEMKKVVAQKADYYRFMSEQNGIMISVDPYIEKDRLKEAFGYDLLSRGVFPVFVVVEVGPVEKREENQK